MLAVMTSDTASDSQRVSAAQNCSDDDGAGGLASGDQKNGVFQK
jgi:hypothetical protein